MDFLHRLEADSKRIKELEAERDQAISKALAFECLVDLSYHIELFYEYGANYKARCWYKDKGYTAQGRSPLEAILALHDKVKKSDVVSS